jgi:magnesium-dependent phosphatase-1
LDGCLWKPELFELIPIRNPEVILTNPFLTRVEETDDIPGTNLVSAGGDRLTLLGTTREILYNLFYQEEWLPTLVGISSRTERPDWALEALSQFSIHSQENHDSMPPFPMQDVFTSAELCVLDKNMDKTAQFEQLLKKANTMLPSNKLRFKDMLFFDNEAGNCKAVAQLGVTAVYCPHDGLTQDAWEIGVRNFPASKVLGSKMPY